VCVAGCEAVDVEDGTRVRIGSLTLKEGDYLSINGFTGNVYGGDIPVVESEVIQVVQGKLDERRSEKYRIFATFLKWADEVRLLDPPLHEFLPKREELMVEIARLELTGGATEVIEEKRRLLERVEELHEFNPMLGLRGCRLGITMPEITRMQTRAIIEAACEINREGIKVVPEIMVPLVGLAAEMKAEKDLIHEVADETMRRYQTTFRYLIGT